MEKPETKISDAANAAKLNEKGLDVETASLPVVSNALKLLFGFCDFDHVDVLQERPAGDHTHITLALPENYGPLAGRLETVMKPFAQKIHKGMVSAWRADVNPMESYPYHLVSLELDISSDQKPALMKTLASFVNEEAALGNEPFTWFTGDRSFLLKQLSHIQQAGNGHGVAQPITARKSAGRW